jgi:hypothetical protein
MQENNKIDFKIGDLVTIKSRPEYWSSLCCDNDPIDNTSPIKYPYTAKIENIKVDYDYGNDLGAKIGDYGWDLSELIKKDLITNVNPTENEIILIPEKLMFVTKQIGTYTHKKAKKVFAKIGNKVLAWDNYEKTFAAVWDFAEEIQ